MLASCVEPLRTAAFEWTLCEGACDRRENAANDALSADNCQSDSDKKSCETRENAGLRDARARAFWTFSPPTVRLVEWRGRWPQPTQGFWAWNQRSETLPPPPGWSLSNVSPASRSRRAPRAAQSPRRYSPPRAGSA